MTAIIRLARPVEIPLLERCGYRAVRQRGGLVEMEPPERGELKTEGSYEPVDRDAERLAFEVMANFMGANV